MLFSHMIIDVCKIVYANIFSPGTKKIIGVYYCCQQICQRQLYTQIFYYNIDEEYFVYTNNNDNVKLFIDCICMKHKV